MSNQFTDETLAALIEDYPGGGIVVSLAHEVRRLRALCGDGEERRLRRAQNNMLTFELDALRAKLDTIDDLHDFDHQNNPRCVTCLIPWPCPTHLVLCSECEKK